MSDYIRYYRGGENITSSRQYTVISWQAARDREDGWGTTKESFTAYAYVDDLTGLITADIDKFERWIESAQ